MGYGSQGAVKSPHFQGLLFPNPGPAASSAATGHATEMSRACLWRTGTVKPLSTRSHKVPHPSGIPITPRPPGSLLQSQVPQSASRPHLKIRPKGPEEGNCNRISTYRSSPSRSVHFDCSWSACNTKLVGPEGPVHLDGSSRRQALTWWEQLLGVRRL